MYYGIEWTRILRHVWKRGTQQAASLGARVSEHAAAAIASDLQQ